MGSLSRRVLTAAAAVYLCLPAQRAEAMAKSDLRTFPAAPGWITSAVMDSSKTFAYFGTNGSSPGAAVQVSLSNFMYVSSVTLSVSSASANFTLIDPQNRFLIFASTSTTGVITKVKLPEFVEVDTTTLPSSYTVTSALIDGSGTFAYFGVGTSSNVVVKMQLSDLTIVHELLLNADEGPLTASAIDKVANIAYFGTSSSPARVIKVNLGAGAAVMSKAGTRDLASGHDNIASAVLSTTTRMAYFGSGDLFSSVFRINLDTFLEASAVDLVYPLTSAAIDDDSEFAYFGSSSTPGIVFRIELNPFEFSGAAVLDAGDNNLSCALIDTGAEFGYFGTSTDPGRVVKVDLNDERAGPPIILTQPSGQVVNLDATATFSITAGGTPPLSYQWLRNGVAIAGATSTSYTTPAVTFDDDSAVFTCTVTNSLGSATSQGAVLTVKPVVKAYPNPWRVDRHSPPMYFEGVPPNATLKIFTLSMHWVKSIQGTDPLQWDLTNDSGQPVASGFYFYVVKTGNDLQTVTGKIAVIR